MESLFGQLVPKGSAHDCDEVTSGAEDIQTDPLAENVH